MEEDWDIFEFAFEGYEWHYDKARRNWQKHGITFEEAARIFEGAVAARSEIQDGEERFLAIGWTGQREIAVAFAEREGRCRIISARKPTPTERRRYRVLLGG